jgi:hypothetical protein
MPGCAPAPALPWYMRFANTEFTDSREPPCLGLGSWCHWLWQPSACLLGLQQRVAS